MEKQKNGNYQILTPLKVNLENLPKEKNFKFPKELENKLIIEGPEKLSQISFCAKINFE
jgi:hypothetical protein